MENKDNGVWLDDLLTDKRLSGTEKLWRDIYRVADEFRLMVRFHRYPLTMMRAQYAVSIYKVVNKKWTIQFKQEGMELEPLLKGIRKTLDNYKDEHKEYIIQKAGGGEFI